ncbi:hypothetical protein C6I20_02070 [Aeromicrobium sp. A1-2]|nr:hypothetical protein C6I20_02070 [Aeromicrobium sp. A1-2]
MNAPQVKNPEDDPAAAVFDARPTYGQQLAEAFCAFIEHLPGDKLPQTAGVGVTLAISIDLKSLIDGIRAGTLSTGCRVAAGKVRRMACEQGLLPMVFNGTSLPLGCGRKERCFNREQRRAMDQRDGGIPSTRGARDTPARPTYGAAGLRPAEAVPPDRAAQAAELDQRHRRPARRGVRGSGRRWQGWDDQSVHGASRRPRSGGRSSAPATRHAAGRRATASAPRRRDRSGPGRRRSSDGRPAGRPGR